MEGLDIESVQEEAIDEGLGILIRNKKLFHGSATESMEKLKAAEETTVGEGVYLTSRLEDALGYGRARGEAKKSNPVVYSCNIENIKLLNLTSVENIKNILVGFKDVLVSELNREGITWPYKNSLIKTIEILSLDSVPDLKEVTQKFGNLFTNYVKSLGYEGVIAKEGGEGDFVGEHDTYLIFDPENLKNLKTEPVSG